MAPYAISEARQTGCTQKQASTGCKDMFKGLVIISGLKIATTVRREWLQVLLPALKNKSNEDIRVYVLCA